jgi:hypothetical protein
MTQISFSLGAGSEGEPVDNRSVPSYYSYISSRPGSTGKVTMEGRTVNHADT